MVPVSNAVAGLWFWSGRERANSLYMDQLRKRKRRLPTNAFNANILLRLEKAWSPCVYTPVSFACTFHLI